MKLHIVSRSRYPAGDPSHWFVAEIGSLQCFYKESGVHTELGEAVEQISEALFLPIHRAQHDGLSYRGQGGIFEITADTEFRVDRDADVDRPSSDNLLAGYRSGGL